MGDAPAGKCQLLRSLHTPGDPLLLPNAWDVATARAVVAAGFPVVATTSWGVAESLGFEDDERAPAEEMLAAAARIARGVDVPVTVDVEAGYGMAPDEVVAALLDLGAAGCNIEDTDHSTGELHPLDDRADYVAGMREAAESSGYPLVINARVDTLLWPYEAGAAPGSQRALVGDAVARSNAYLEAGADCAYPVALWEPDAMDEFMASAAGPVNISRVPQMTSLDGATRAGAARISWAIFLYLDAMARFAEELTALRPTDRPTE